MMDCGPCVENIIIVRQSLADQTTQDFNGFANIILNDEVNVQMSEDNLSSFNLLQNMVRALTSQIRGITCVDSEGGRITRWGNDMPAVPSAYALSLCPEEWLSEAADIMGLQLVSSGIDMLLGPVADIGVETTPFPSRCYGSNPQDVYRRLLQILEVLKTHVLVCLKHFPGHGAVSVDSHNGRSHSDLVLADFELVHLKPFLNLMPYVDAIMTAHITTVLDERNPATFSLQTLNKLREKGFDGVIISDSLTMGAVQEKYDNDNLQIAIDAIKAGCDMLITGDLSLKEVVELKIALIKEVEEDEILMDRIRESAARVDTLYLKRNEKKRNPVSVDVEALAAKAREFAARVAKKALFTKKDNESVLNKNSNPAILSPELLINKVRSACSAAFSEDVIQHSWKGLSPSQDEVERLVDEIANKKDVLIFTYNGTVNLAQQALIERISHLEHEPRVWICEGNYLPKKEGVLDWIPTEAGFACAYSADPISLQVAIESFMTL